MAFGELDANENVLCAYFGILFDKEHRDTSAAPTGVAFLANKNRIVYGYCHKFLWMKNELLKTMDLKAGTKVDVHGTDSLTRNVVSIENDVWSLTFQMISPDAAQLFGDQALKLIK